jgi:hypothetical protein
MTKFKALLLSSALLMVLGGLAMAQDRDNDDRYSRDRDDYRNDHHDNDNHQWGRDRDADSREYGFHNGYRDGWNTGRDAHAQRGDRDYRRNDDSNGYQDWMGSRGQYKKGYEDGYRAGYSDSYNGRSNRYPYVYGQNGQRSPWDPGGNTGNAYGVCGQGGYGQQQSDRYRNGPASEWGCKDGLEAGQRDRNDRHSARAAEWEAYRDADHGMSSSSGYGDPEQYKREYREAFLEGYNLGYGQPGDGSAVRFGTQDGLEAGQRDRNGGHSYRPTEWQAYKDADHGLSSSNGYRDSEDYKQSYRQAFMNGYSQGYGSRR